MKCSKCGKKASDEYKALSNKVSRRNANINYSDELSISETGINTPCQ